MTEADKMFEELGYSKLEDKKIISYRSLSHKKTFLFYKIVKKCKCEYTLQEKSYWFNMQELQAINQKCMELGWL